MHQEPADKFFVADGDLPFWVTGLFPPCGEGDLCFRYGQDPVVGDGNPVGIPSQIFDRIPETVEGFFDVWAPAELWSQRKDHELYAAGLPVSYRF